MISVRYAFRSMRSAGSYRRASIGLPATAALSALAAAGFALARYCHAWLPSIAEGRQPGKQSSGQLWITEWRRLLPCLDS
jgi:hypothetical protein